MLKNHPGQILVLTLLTLGVGALGTGAMLGVVNSTTRGSGAFLEGTDAYYASAAGVEFVMADLLAGVDALDGSYTLPDLIVNDQEITVLVSSPQTSIHPATEYRYVDPGAASGLASLASGDTWSVKLNGVQPFSTLFVNWAFTPQTTGDLRIRVLDSGGGEIASSANPGALGMPAVAVARLASGDTYTVEFKNQASGRSSPGPSAPTGAASGPGYWSSLLARTT